MRGGLFCWRRLLALALLVLPALAFAQQAQEQEVKAAFLYKFPAFVEWPRHADPDAAFVIAVVRAPEVAAELRSITRGRSLGSRRIEVREFDGPPLGLADLLFVGRAAAAQLPPLTKTTAGAPTLIVSESPGALEHGSVINFLIVDGRVRFEVSVEQARARGLSISARLLALAHGLRGGRS